MSHEPTEYESDLVIDRVMLYKGRNSRYFNAARKASMCSSEVKLFLNVFIII